MTKVFVAGSRSVSRLDAEVKERLDRIVAKKLHVLVGDANGADKAIQDYLRVMGHELVEVFCSGDSCRNNRGGWPVRAVQVPRSGKRKDFAFYATKDRTMAHEATVGLMLWDGKSVGTLMNVARLVREDKKVAIYLAPRKEFVEVRSRSDWARLLSECDPDMQLRVKRESAAESGERGVASQQNLL
jgi:hypothetical protein